MTKLQTISSSGKWGIAIMCIIAIIGCRQSGQIQFDKEFKQGLECIAHSNVMDDSSMKAVRTLGTRVQSETNPVLRVAMYAAYTNAVVETPIVLFFPSEKGLHPSIHVGFGDLPEHYRPFIAFRRLVAAAKETVGITNNFDALCLSLDVWVRLKRDRMNHASTVEEWAMKARRHCAVSQNDIDTVKKDYFDALSSEMRSIELHAERWCWRFDEHKQVYRRFEEVIGRPPKRPDQK